MATESEIKRVTKRFEDAVVKLERQRQRRSLSASLQQTSAEREYDAALLELTKMLRRS